MNPQIRLYVDGVKRGRLRHAPNHYTGQEDARQQMWKVTLRYDRFPDRSLDCWFQSEPEARQFGSEGMRSLAEVFQALAPFNAKFTSTEPAREQHAARLNRYTDQVAARPSWHTLLWCEDLNRYADLWYGDQQGDQAEAAKWAPNVAYGPLDFLRVFRILVTFYPAAEYVRGMQTEGFFDERGFHRPGVYPHGRYPAGFFTGQFIALEGVTGPALGRSGFLLLTAAQAALLGHRYGIQSWQIVGV